MGWTLGLRYRWRIGKLRGCENNVYAFLIGMVPLGLSPSTFFRYAYILGEVLTGSIDQTKM